MANKYTMGQEVYDLHGRSGRYVAKAAGGHIVEPIYDADDDQSHYAAAETWHEVFGTPPRERLHADIAAIEATLTERQAKLTAVRADIAAAERQAVESRRLISANPDLADLDLWLKGKVTHIVSLGYQTRIGTVEEILQSNDRDRSLRLLNLRVDSRASRYWVSIAGYSDGSGDQTRCLLATSLEHAKERLRDHIAAKELVRDGSAHDLISVARDAVKYGVEISAALREKLAISEREGTAANLKNARAEAERAQQRLEEAMQRAKQAGVPL